MREPTGVWFDGNARNVSIFVVEYFNMRYVCELGFHTKSESPIGRLFTIY